MLKTVKLKEVKPLLSVVSQEVAFRILKNLPQQFDPTVVPSSDMCDVLNRLRAQSRTTLVTVPRTLEELANGAFFSCAELKELSELSGIGEFDLPHHGLPLDSIGPKLFMLGLPESFDKEEVYIRMTNYYMMHICRTNEGRRELNEIFDALAYDVLNVTRIAGNGHQLVHDTLEEEDTFIKELFNTPIFHAIIPQRRGRILAGTSHSFKRRVQALWRTYSVE